MARPRIFISSTFYDLKHVRSDLERFVRDLGYEAVMNERGTIPYGYDEKIEEYCYKEIEACDIIVSIVGGNFGSKSQHGNLSISQAEVLKALENDTPCYIFIEKNVKSEYATYCINKENETVKYRHVENTETFKFIEFAESLQKNNIIFSFESTQDITHILRDQWAGLFQRFLQERGRIKDINISEKLESTATTLQQLIQHISEQQQKGTHEVIRSIIFLNHPAFSTTKKLLGIKYRVVFKNIAELNALFDARQYARVAEDECDDDKYMEWIERKSSFPKKLIKIYKGIFDENRDLKEYTEKEWDEDWMRIEKIDPVTDDEIPF